MKAKYRIRNWNQYNKSLIQRGNITVWFSEDAIKKWAAPREVGKRGRPKLFSDDALLHNSPQRPLSSQRKYENFPF
jgi:hypothetical protein